MLYHVMCEVGAQGGLGGGVVLCICTRGTPISYHFHTLCETGQNRLFRNIPLQSGISYVTTRCVITR